MARKPRIHYPGAFYHVIIRGNDGQNIFFSKADRDRFYLLLRDGAERYKHRFHAFCLMTNHVHLLIEVGDNPLPLIMQNLNVRYTRYINRQKKRVGHLFQGRYKALLIDKDNYLLELVRYIHCNPIRAGLVNALDTYAWSSHPAYLGKVSIPWMTTELVLAQFAQQANKARELYLKFTQAGINESHRREFHFGSHEGRILGNDHFSENALGRAEEKLRHHYSLDQIIDTICSVYTIEPDILVEPGKRQPAAEARSVAAYLVQEEKNISMTELGNFVQRDIAALSRGAGRIREKGATIPGLKKKLAAIRKGLQQISKYQA